MPPIPDSAIDLLFNIVDRLYGRLKTRFLGPSTKENKPLLISYSPRGILGDMFHTTSLKEGVRPNLEKVTKLGRIAGTYLDAAKERTKARLAHELNAAVEEAHKDPQVNSEEVLSNALDNVIKKATNEIKTIVESETNRAKQVSGIEAIHAVAASRNISDPTVIFITIKDAHICKNCIKMHLLEDKITPRAWKLSEIGSGYAPKNPTHPYVGDLHPNGRCVPVIVLPGWGCVGGKLTYISPDYDLYKDQRG